MTLDTRSKVKAAAKAAKDPVSRAAAIQALGLWRRDDLDFASESLRLEARLYAADGRSDEAEAAYRAAGVAELEDGVEPWAVVGFAEILSARDPEGADTFLRKATQLGYTQPEVVVMHGRIALSSRNPPSDVDALAESAIAASPRDRLIVESWYDYVKSRTSHEDAIAALCAVQERADAPLLNVILSLEAHMGNAWVRSTFQAMLATYQETPLLKAYARIWDAILSDVSPDLKDCKAISKDRGRNDQLFFHFVVASPTQLPLHRDQSIAKLEEAGIDRAALVSFADSFLQVTNDTWIKALETSSIVEPVARATYLSAERECAFLDNVVTEKRLTVADPFTGEMLDAAESFIAFGRTLYVFHGKELFLLVCGKPWSGAVGLFIPRLSMAVPFGKSPSGLLGDAMPNVLAELLKKFVRRAISPKRLDQPECARTVTLSVPSTENFAHHVWNFYSAIERLIVCGAQNKIDRVVFSGTEFFGPLANLFPELADRIERPVKNNIIDPYDDPTKGIVVQSGGFFVARSLIERIRVAMKRAEKRIADAADPSDYNLQGRPVVWLAMRLRDKGWVDQEAGLSVIIARMAERFPNAVFVLDGFSYPVGEDGISNAWQDVISALTAMANRIVAASGVANPVISMVGNTLRESVLWAEKTDVYLAPYGTTQHKIGWFTDAPGLVYVPPNFSESVANRSPGACAVDFGTKPTFIFAEAASAGERRGLNRTRERFANVAMDAEILSQQLSDLLAARIAQKGIFDGAA